MSMNDRKKKLVLFFAKIFEDEFELNTYYAERILKYLQETPLNGFETNLLESSFFSDILMKTYNGCEVKTNSVKIFIANVVSVIYKNELQFSKLTNMLRFHRFLQYMCNYNSKCAKYSDLLYASINMVTSPIAHYSGVNWLVENKMWHYVLCCCTHTRPPHVSRAAYNFIAQLLWKLIEFDDDVVLAEIIEYIIKPVRHNQYHITNTIKDGEEKNVYAPMMSSLNAMLVVLGSSDDQITKSYKIAPILMQRFNFDTHLQVILDVTRDPSLARILCEVLFKLYLNALLDAYHKKKKNDSEILNEVTSIYNNVLQKLIMKQMSEAVADFVVKCNLFLAKLGAKRQKFFERDGKKFEFQNQFVLHLVVPMWTYHSLNCGSEAKLIEKDNYSFKLANVTAEHITQSAELFQKVVQNNAAYVKQVTIYTVKNLFQFRGQLTKATAGILYQGLYYVLKTFIMSDDVGNHLILSENPLRSPDDVRLLSLVLDAIKMLLKEHHINWYENLEIICLQVTLLNLMKQKFMCAKGLVQTIDLINLSVRNFLSPDMQLLVESHSGSSLSEIGAMTKEYMQHPDWEVRESALSLLLSCTDVSFVKYIPLQKVISSNHLMLLAATSALSEAEPYAQATALQCLAAAAKIDKIWMDVKNVHPNLYVQLINLAQRNLEDIIRKEATNVLTEIFLHQNISYEFKNCLFRVMAKVALNDLHFEVQTAALNFWRHAIKRLCLDRGMVDGNFPTVTFSKEKRKIVVFNDNEIKKQLNNIMNDLSSIGCLNVLDKCLDIEQNVAVIEEAYKIVTELKVVLDNYKFSPTETATPKEDLTESKTQIDIDYEMEGCTEMYTSHGAMFDLQELIIDEITNTPQSDLIMDILDKRPEEQKELLETHDSVQNPIQPYTFLQKVSSNDYQAIINMKKGWRPDETNLDDLIDEILSNQSALQMNTIDMCDV
ncbi:hypothetical protein RR48_07141 [Papilio machaon]|uniref:BRCA1-associated ATM activator 1 n=1 Tax=Papilio machaon TaxID=76193 RepID=A0A194RIK1_PAPMA|nr:hypothetical protein RR48_07141 [Papilio machaon]